MLVLIGATPEGKEELIGFQVGERESAQSWRELLVKAKSRGLEIAPEIAVGDPPLCTPFYARALPSFEAVLHHPESERRSDCEAEMESANSMGVKYRRGQQIKPGR